MSRLGSSRHCARGGWGTAQHPTVPRTHPEKDTQGRASGPPAQQKPPETRWVGERPRPSVPPLSSEPSDNEADVPKRQMKALQSQEKEGQGSSGQQGRGLSQVPGGGQVQRGKPGSGMALVKVTYRPREFRVTLEGTEAAGWHCDSQGRGAVAHPSCCLRALQVSSSVRRAGRAASKAIPRAMPGLGLLTQRVGSSGWGRGSPGQPRQAGLLGRCWKVCWGLGPAAPRSGPGSCSQRDLEQALAPLWAPMGTKGDTGGHHSPDSGTPGDPPLAAK